MLSCSRLWSGIRPGRPVHGVKCVELCMCLALCTRLLVTGWCCRGRRTPWQASHSPHRHLQSGPEWSPVSSWAWNCTRWKGKSAREPGSWAWWVLRWGEGRERGKLRSSGIIQDCRVITPGLFSGRLIFRWVTWRWASSLFYYSSPHSLLVWVCCLRILRDERRIGRTK